MFSIAQIGFGQSLMPEIVIAVLIGFASFLLSFICGQWFRPLGGIVYTVFLLPMRFRWIGKFYKTVFVDLFKLTFLFKLAGFVISSSGVLFPITVIHYSFPDFLYQPEVIWGALFASIIVNLSVMDRVASMKVSNIFDFSPELKRYTSIDIKMIDDETLKQLAFMQFIDLAFIDLFVIVICFGTTLYCGVFLGFLIDVDGVVLSPIDTLVSVFAFVNVVSGESVRIVGFWSGVINIFYGASLVLFTIFYVGLASNFIEVKRSP